VVFISHDRTFIDALADKVAALEDGALNVSEGGYEAYVAARLERLAGLTKAYKVETTRIRQLQKSVVILQQKAIRGKGLSQYHRRKEELENLKESHKSGPPEHRQSKIRITEHASKFHEGRLIARIEKGAFAYEGKAPLFKDVSLEMRTGSHIILLGRNGSGKSTFLQCLLGALPLSKGDISWMHGVKTAYFDQHAAFDPQKSALAIVMEKLQVIEDVALEALGAMRFTSERARTKVEHLSGGERMRLRFALVFGAKPNFLLLDEPTNHLDEVTWEILLEAVNKSPSTILLVTHDYEFIEGVESKLFWLLNKGTVLERHKELFELVEELR
jgi:ATPase subunit of ABC transporter with duplicated ATPase domains